MDGETADSTAAHAEPSYRVELEDLKAKTSKWKAVVKQQLADAASKNERLRTDLASANSRADAAAAATRLELTAEFRERTADKDEEIRALRQRLVAAHATAKEAVAKHNEAQEALEARGKAELQAATDAHAAELEARTAQLRAVHDTEIERERRGADTLRGELRASAVKLEGLEKRLAAGGSDEGGEAPTNAAHPNVADLAQQVQTLERQLAEGHTERRALAARLSADAQRHEESLAGVVEKTRAQARAEMARRDEQLHVANAMLAQAREELSATLVRVHRVEAASGAAVDAAERQAAAVAGQLAAKLAEAQELRAAIVSLEATVTRQQSELADAAAEAASREAALDDLFERHVKGGVASLPAPAAANSAPHVTSGRTDADATRIAELEEDLLRLQARLESAEDAIAGRERAVATREAQTLELQRRVHGHQQQLAVEAQRLQHLHQQSSHEHATSDGLQGGTRPVRRGSVAGPNAPLPAASSDALASVTAALNTGRLMATTHGVLLWQRHRRAMPLLLVAVLLVILYAGVGMTPVGGAAGSAAVAAGREDALLTAHKRLDDTMNKLVQCEEAVAAAQRKRGVKS